MLRFVGPEAGGLAELHLPAPHEAAVVIGRAPVGGVELPTQPGMPPLSRRHALLGRRADGSVCVRDISSGCGPSHGVYVNSVALRRSVDCTLRDKDILTLGPPRVALLDGSRRDNPWKFQYHEQPSPPRLPPPPPHGRRAEDDLCDTYTCPVCLDLAAHATSPPCGHTFCGACIAAWMSNGAGASR